MLNKVTLIGRLGADPEVRYMPAGGAVANITLATNFRWRTSGAAMHRKETPNSANGYRNATTQWSGSNQALKS